MVMALIHSFHHLPRSLDPVGLDDPHEWVKDTAWPSIKTGQECDFSRTNPKHGHDPEVWLADALERLPAMTNRDDLGVLLPCGWQPAAAPAARTAEACPA